MGRILRYGFNKIYTIYNSMLGVKVGKKSLIHCSSDLRYKKNISIGRRTIFYKNLTIYVGKKGTFSIGSDAHIAPYAYFLVENKKITIGNNSAIGAFSSLFCSSGTPVLSEIPFQEALIHEDIKIGNNVVIAAHCIVLPGTEIEDNVFVAANSVVKGKLLSGWIYGGSPCKPIKKLSEDD